MITLKTACSADGNQSVRRLFTQTKPEKSDSGGGTVTHKEMFQQGSKRSDL